MVDDILHHAKLDAANNGFGLFPILGRPRCQTRPSYGMGFIMEGELLCAQDLEETNPRVEPDALATDAEETGDDPSKEARSSLCSE